MAFNPPQRLRQEEVSPVPVKYESFTLEVDDGVRVHRLRLDFEASSELEFWRPYLEQWKEVVEMTTKLSK